MDQSLGNRDQAMLQILLRVGATSLGPPTNINCLQSEISGSTHRIQIPLITRHFIESQQPHQTAAFTKPHGMDQRRHGLHALVSNVHVSPEGRSAVIGRRGVAAFGALDIQEFLGNLLYACVILDQADVIEQGHGVNPTAGEVGAVAGMRGPDEILVLQFDKPLDG